MKIQSNRLLNEEAALPAIVILDSGHAKVGQEWWYKGQCSPYSRLYYILAGEGLVSYGETTLPLMPGNVYLIPAELTFDHACDSMMEQLYFHVQVLPLSGYELFARHPKGLVLPVAETMVDSLLAAYQSERLPDLIAVQNRVREDVASFLLMAGLDAAATRADSPFLSAVFRTVRGNLSAKLTIARVADMLSMAESTLARRFRQEAGMTLGRYLNGLLMQEARRRLLHTKTPIGQIAEDMEFCDAFYFSRFFRLHEGETPSRYRRDRALII